MAKVFLPHRSDKDVASAGVYGEITYLCESCQVFEVEETLQTFNNALDSLNFDPKLDFICMTGRPLALAFLLALAVRKYGEVRLLFHHSRFNSYRMRTFTVEDLCTTTSDNSPTISKN